MIRSILATRPLLRRTLGSALLSLLAAPAAPAQNAASALPQLTVRYDDLNLSSDAGTTILLHRLERAARRVCGDTNERQPLAQLAEFRHCEAQSLERAIIAVNTHKLTIAYRNKYRNEPSASVNRTPG
jgi:UrcA family protein